jgi:hypothetical protein
MDSRCRLVLTWRCRALGPGEVGRCAIDSSFGLWDPANIPKERTTVAAGTLLVTSAFAQSAREVRGASPYIPVKSEAPPKLFVDPPLPEGLAIGVYWAQYRVENLRIVQVFGPEASQVSPRVGHLHIIVDDLPWWWADASDNNTVDIANFPPGQHKVKIQLVNSNHEVFPGQEVIHTFTIPAQKAPERAGR